jgi:hypothetical protein
VGAGGNRCRVRTATFSARDTNQGKEYSRWHYKGFFDKRGGDKTPKRHMSEMTHLMCADHTDRSRRRIAACAHSTASVNPPPLGPNGNRFSGGSTTETDDVELLRHCATQDARGARDRLSDFGIATIV